MGDRRVADRREPEQGVVKIKLKDLIIYCLIGVIIVASVIGNVVLGILYSRVKKQYDELVMEKDAVYDFDEEELMDEELIDSELENEIDDNDNDNEEIETSDNTDENTCELVLLGETNKINRGESATFELKANNINAGSGIIMFETLFECDGDSIECTIEPDDDGQWKKTGMVDNYLTMMRDDLMPSSEDQTIAKITITAKKTAKVGEQTVELKSIKFTTEDDNYFNLQDKKLIINIQ